jgi:hypothetical protein
MTLILGFVFFFSCRNQSDFGFDILPEDDKNKPEIIDTFSIEVYTMPEDTITANNASTLLLGEYIDPIFGQSKASFVSQFGLSDYPDFTPTDIVDSVILTLTLDTNEVNYYGNIVTPQLLKIYKLPSDFDSEETYHSNHDLSDFNTGEILGTYNYTYDSAIDTLHIPLDPSLAESFFNADESIFSTSEDFINFFKGIFVTTNCMGHNGAILKFKVSSYTAIRVYYHKAGTTVAEDPFIITSNLLAAKKFNLFQHDYSSTSFLNQIGDETSPQDSVAYLQSMGGLRVKIKIPHLEDLKSLGEIAVFRAELVVNTAPSTLTYDSQYTKMKYTMLAGIDLENEFYLLPEYYSGTSYLPNALETDEYRFEIASYVREVLDGTIQNNGIWLFPYAASDNYTRSVITTGNHSDKMKLIISYVKL